MHYSRSKDRKQNESKHRGLLTGMMGFGDILLSESEGISEKDFALINSSRSALEANVRYLREKYEQWYVPIDQHEMDRVWAKLIPA